MLKRIVPLAIIALAVFGFITLKATRPAAPGVEASERAWRVDAMTVAYAHIAPEFTLYGRIEAPDRLRASAPVAGRILAVPVRDGQQVAEGEVLVRMDPRDLEPRLVQARADMERERIRHRHDLEAVKQERELLKLAETKVARAEQLLTRQLGAESTHDQALEDYARTRLALLQREQAISEHPARLAQLQARLDEAERDYQRSEVRAPYAARVGRVEVAGGDQVGTGQTLLTLIPLDGLYLRARLPERHVPHLRDSLARGERLAAVVQYGGQYYPASLERLSGESEVRGVDVWLRLEGQPAIPSGALVSAVLQGPKLEQVVALPFSALHRGDRVYLIEERRLRAVPVERLGERREGEQLLLLVRSDALQDGGRVMTTHLPNAINGLLVEVAGQ